MVYLFPSEFYQELDVIKQHYTSSKGSVLWSLCEDLIPLERKQQKHMVRQFNKYFIAFYNAIVNN